MRRTIAFVLMLVLCASMACSAFAAEADFVPSITYKGEPEIVPIEDDKGDPAIGITYELEDEEQVSFIYQGCLLITPVAKVDTSTAIPSEAAKLLKEVYEALSAGTMKLPYDKIPGYDGEEMVIRELLDVSWLCGTDTSDHDHPTEVRPTGIVFDVTFNLGVKEDDTVVVMTYKNGEWNPIVNVENNGNGTVTCTFEDLCPVAISVAADDGFTPPQTGDDANVVMWIALMVAALAGIAGVAVAVFVRRKAKK